MEKRIEDMVGPAASARQEAHSELAAGQKQGHWIWWVFPTLAQRGGDQFSAMQQPAADLESVEQAIAYATHAGLRAQLLESFQVASRAFSKAASEGKDKVPWRVLDAGFGRQAQGVWIRGPVDAFKVFCSATLFAAIGHKLADRELAVAALNVLDHFVGDVVYQSGGFGTSGYDSTANAPTVNTLIGHDAATLALVGGDWSAIASKPVNGE